MLKYLAIAYILSVLSVLFLIAFVWLTESGWKSILDLPDGEGTPTLAKKHLILRMSRSAIVCTCKWLYAVDDQEIPESRRTDMVLDAWNGHVKAADQRLSLSAK